MACSCRSGYGRVVIGRVLFVGGSLLLLGCVGCSASARASGAASDDGAQPPGTSAAPGRGGASGTAPDDGRPALPSLPAELASSLGSIHTDLIRWHAEPLPTLDRPLNTADEHQRWVDEVLTPWHATQADRQTQVAKGRPLLPPSGASDDAWDARGRAGLVHCAMWQTVLTDQTIVDQFVAVPKQLDQSADHGDDVRRWQRFQMRDARRRAAEITSCLESWALTQQTPPADLAPWLDYCRDLQQDLVRRICEAERAQGLVGADADCTSPADPSRSASDGR